MMINQNLNSKSHFSMLRNFSSCSSLCLFSFFTHSAILGEELFITIVSFTCTISLKLYFLEKLNFYIKSNSAIIVHSFFEMIEIKSSWVMG